jgi:hypothetical protein
MSNYDFKLELVRAPGDAEPFGVSYQQELRTYKAQLGPHRQRAFSMDAFDGGGGPLGEFLFQSAPELIKAAGMIAAGYIAAKVGRKVKLKGKDFEVEARDAKEVTVMLQVLRDHEAASSEKAAPAASAAAPSPKRPAD